METVGEICFGTKGRTELFPDGGAELMSTVSDNLRWNAMEPEDMED